jgi:YHS domain-containing protein
MGSGPMRAHVNYKCECGCIGGVIYSSGMPLSKAGSCCCGRKLWVGDEAEAKLAPYLEDGRDYVWDISSVTLPWGEVAEAAMAWPRDWAEHHAHPSDGPGDHADHEAAQEPSDVLTVLSEAPVRVRDLVCGMMIDPARAAATSEYRGQSYYFCARVCKESFDADPARYAGARGLLGRFLGR